MIDNARPQPRCAQLPGRVQHDAPDDLERTEIARLTAMGRVQRTPTEEKWARRASRKPEARREMLTGATALDMKRLPQV
jgi:hypothetical protein